MEKCYVLAETLMNLKENVCLDGGSCQEWGGGVSIRRNKEEVSTTTKLSAKNILSDCRESSSVGTGMLQGVLLL